MRRHRLSIAALFALAALMAIVWVARQPRGEPSPAPSTGGERVAEAMKPRSDRAVAPRPGVSTGFLRGQVLDADGLPAQGSEVRVLAGEQRLASAFSGADGGFTLGPLEPGEYSLVASAGRGASARGRSALASERLGPIPLAPGEDLGGLILHLLPGGSLAGVVRDAATDEAIEGAALELSGLGAKSDRVGAFRIDGLTPGALRLRVSAPGYEVRELPLTLGAELVTGLEIRLSRGTQIRGRVVDGAGRPLAAALVVVPYRLQAGVRRPAGASGADGSFAITGPAGMFWVEAQSAQGDAGRSELLDVAAGGERDGVEIRLEEAAAFQGNVIDAAGELVVGASVQVTAGDRLLGSGTTGADGRFAIPRIPSGRVQVVALQGEARGRVGPLEVREGEAVELTIQLGGETLRGHALEAGGRGIEGASVAIWPEGGPRSLATVVVTGAGGAFEASGLPGGPLRIEAHFDSLLGERRGVFAREGEVQLVLSGGALVGLVLLEGRPAADFVISASPLEAGQGGGRSQGFLASDGRFRLPLAPGDYEVRASAAGAPVTAARAKVPERGESTELVLELLPGGVIEGRILDAETEAPLEGARVSLRRSGTFAFAQAEDAPGAPQGLSAADGSFRLIGAPSGRMPLFAFKPGYRPIRPVAVEVRPDQPAWVEVRLSPDGRDAAAEEAYGGIGLTLGSSSDGAVIAAEVIGAGPAFAAGIRRGDRILEVDGLALEGERLLSLAVQRIRGPVGTPVTIGLRRGDTDFRVVVVRAELRY